MRLDDYKFKSFCDVKGYKSQKLFIYDTIFMTSASAITTGVVLSGYFIYLGASDILTALINNSASFSAILCIFSFVLFERIVKRKKFLLITNFVSRTIFMLILIIPLIFDTDRMIFVFVASAVILADILFGIYRVGWLVWLMDTAPVQNRVNYIYMRMFYLRCAFSAVTLASGFVLDMFDKGYLGFLILFGFSYILTLLDLYVLSGISDKKYEIDTRTKSFDKFFIPVREKKYRDFLIFMFVFHFSFYMASAYTPVYMIKYLDFDYKFLLTMNVITMISMIMSNLYWMRIENRRGSRYVMFVSTVIRAFGMLIIGFITGQTYFLYYLSAFISGIGAGGFNTTMLYYRFKLMSDAGKTIYESWFYLVFCFASLIAPFAGEQLMKIIPKFTNEVFFNSRLQLLHMISFVFLLICAAYISTGTKEDAPAYDGNAGP